MEMTEGLEYPDYPVLISEDLQREKLRCCGVDASVFGPWTDITGLADATILATKSAGFSINGSVHMGQWFDLREPIALGTPLTLRGRVTQVAPEPRGHIVTSSFDVVREDGSVPLHLERTSLRIDGASEQKGPLGKKRTVPPSRSDFALATQKTLIPGDVAEYSIEAENLIHSDPAVAKEYGFRVPIAGGLMAVRMMMETLAARGVIETLSMSVRFRRPMFWDDTLDVCTDAPEAPSQYYVFREDGKVANEATVESVTFR